MRGNLSAPGTARAVAYYLSEGRVGDADTHITEMFGQVIDPTRTLPDGIFDEPESTGDVHYDTLLATGIVYALTARGLQPARWMWDVPPLDHEWFWSDPDGIASTAWKDRMRREAPSVFLAKNIVARDRDVRTA